LTPERWQQIKTVLEDALERKGDDRTAFLAETCADDDELREEVESLLASEDEVEDFIETPVFRIHPDGWEPLAAGERIGAYRVLREIGRGGMGSVYLAERADEVFEKQVAVKVVRRGMDTDEIVRRFHSERLLLARLDHPNIARLFDGGTTEDGRPYFVMEYVEGQPIDQYCDERKLPTRERLELFRQVCSAVHFAHQNLIVHRDLKPGNILVTAEGVPKLLDFGIAKLLGPDEDLLAPTRLDQRPMTPEYASPEQVRGDLVTTASDVYGLGVLLYVLLTGHRPYRAATGDPQSLAKAILDSDPPRPSTAVGRTVEEVTPEAVSRVRDGEERLLRRRLAGDLDNIVLMAMRKEPQRRYASVDQLSNDIGRHLQNLPVIARKDTLGYRTAKFVGRHKLGLTVAALFLLMIAGFAVSWQRAVRERERSDVISKFLEDLFTNPDPSRARGQEITARQVLDAGVQAINTDLQDQPELRADLLATMGRVYRKLGLYESAKKLLEESLQLRGQSFGDNDLRTAESLHNLAGVLRDMGDNTGAERLVRKALSIQLDQGEMETLDYASGLNNLASILEDKGETDQAERYFKESLAIKRRLPKVDEDDIALSLNNIAKVQSEQGDYRSAESTIREALEIRRRLAGGLPDVGTATNLSTLASLLEDMGRLQEAEANYRESLKIRRQLFPKDPHHPLIAKALSNLGYVLLAREKADEAEKCFREALMTPEERLKPIERASFLKNLASALLQLKRPAEAETKVREALAIFRQAEHPIPWRIADAESLLGACLTAQGRYKEAEPLLVQGYAVLAKDEGNGAARAPDALRRLVALYTAWGKPERAAEFQAKLPAPTQTAAAQH
jgi:serine/threonine protein kinase/Flp pilus assembly protein TadD